MTTYVTLVVALSALVVSLIALAATVAEFRRNRRP